MINFAQKKKQQKNKTTVRNFDKKNAILGNSLYYSSDV